MDRPPGLRLRRLLHHLLLTILCFPLSSRSEVAPMSAADLVRQVEEMKLKVATLETVLAQTVEDLHAKDLYLDRKEKQLEEIENRILSLESSFVDAKLLEGELAHYEVKITQLEEEVQRLWGASRRNNFEIHLLERKLLDSSEKLKELKSQAINMGDVITEQWHQIQHLEQALQIAKVRARNRRWEINLVKCSFLKMSKNFYTKHLKGLLCIFYPVYSRSSSYLSRVFHQLERIFSAAQKYHFELQGSIMEMMEKNELTAPLVNDELVFFLASALITFPVVGAWIFCTSFFS